MSRGWCSRCPRRTNNESEVCGRCLSEARREQARRKRCQHPGCEVRLLWTFPHFKRFCEAHVAEARAKSKAAATVAYTRRERAHRRVYGQCAWCKTHVSEINPHTYVRYSKCRRCRLIESERYQGSPRQLRRLEETRRKYDESAAG